MNACLVYGMKGTVRVSAPLPFPVSTVAFFCGNLVRCVGTVAQNCSQLKRVVIFDFPIVVTGTPNYFVGSRTPRRETAGLFTRRIGPGKLGGPRKNM
jgi:hypothetical protein